MASEITTKKFALSEARFTDVVRREFILKNRFLVLGSALVIAVIAVLSIWGYSRGTGFEVFIAWVPLLVMIAIWWLWLLWGMPKYSFRTPLNRGGFTQRQYVFHSDHLVVETDDGVYLKAPYRHFPRIRLGSDYVVLQETVATFHILPSEAFESEEHVEALRERLARFAGGA